MGIFGHTYYTGDVLKGHTLSWYKIIFNLYSVFPLELLINLEFPHKIKNYCVMYIMNAYF